MLNPEAKKVGLFCSTTSHLRDTRLSKIVTIGKNTTWSHNVLEHCNGQILYKKLCTCTYQLDPHFSQLRSKTNRFRNTSCRKSLKTEVHWITPERHWTFNGQKYSVYTKYLIPMFKLWSVLPHGQPFSKFKVVKKHRRNSGWPWTLNRQND